MNKASMILSLASMYNMPYLDTMHRMSLSQLTVLYNSLNKAYKLYYTFTNYTEDREVR